MWTTDRIWISVGESVIGGWVLTLLGAGDDVLEEVQGDRVVWWQVRPDVEREELVDLALGAELRREGGDGDRLVVGVKDLAAFHVAELI